MSTKKGSKEDIAIESAAVKEESCVYKEIDPIAEKKLLRKLDSILLPMFCLICKRRNSL
jgi:hypothetical protein